MNTTDINQEWGFVVAETHGEQSSKVNLVKREILFFLQILLSKISFMTNAIDLRSLEKNYYGLKELYKKDGINGHIIWKR